MTDSPKVEPPKDKIHKLLDKFKEETEDLWEHFMEGVDPDPEKYDQFLDNAYDKATQSILALLKLQQEALLNDLKTKKVKGANLIEMKWIDKALNKLRLEL